MSNKNLSRRSFLKGAAVSALGMAAIPALSLGRIHPGHLFCRGQGVRRLHHRDPDFL